jgi:hypothetical protein
VGSGFGICIEKFIDGSSGPITEATLYIDSISLVNGGVGFTIGVVDIFTPTDAEELEGFVQKANAKVRQQ